MQRPAVLCRHRGHRETPVVAFLMWLFCTFGLGFMTVVRDLKRAEKVGATLNLAQKWTAFWQGCAWGTLSFFVLLVALMLVVGINLWLENWRWKRKAQRQKKP